MLGLDNNGTVCGLIQRTSDLHQKIVRPLAVEGPAALGEREGLRWWLSRLPGLAGCANSPFHHPQILRVVEWRASLGG